MSTPTDKSRPISPEPPPPPAWWLRVLPRRKVAVPVVVGILTMALASGTGFGASAATDQVTANVLSTISLTSPTALDSVPPVCGTAVSALNADGCPATYAAGATDTLQLGELAVTDVEARRLTWKVTTTSTTGYSVQLRNTSPGDVLQSASDTIPDMPASPMTPAAAVDTATQFGVAAGDPESDNQASVSFGGSPWESTSGQQGELFRGIPSTGIVVAQRTTPQVNDPFSLTFAAASVFSDQPKNGEYTGLLRLTASTI